MRDLTYLNNYRLKADELMLYGVNGDGTCGIFKVFVHGKSFRVVASSGGGWDHVSVSPGNPNRQKCPTWEEMCAIKDMFFEKEEVAIQYHPAESEYVNMHPYCLHLWRPQARFMPTPPKIFV